MSSAWWAVDSNRKFSTWRSAVAVVLAAAMLPWSALAQNGSNSGFNVKKNVEIVLVNVVVRDKQGNVVKGLTLSLIHI